MIIGFIMFGAITNEHETFTIAAGKHSEKRVKAHNKHRTQSNEMDGVKSIFEMEMSSAWSFDMCE
jgi:hypothetical protein